MSDIRGGRRVRFIVLGAAALLVLGIAGAVTAAGAVGGHTDDRAPVTAQQTDGPVALTDAQCAAASQTAKWTMDDARSRFPGEEGEAVVSAVETEYRAAMDWVAAGCPPDPVRGFYPAESGNGGSIRVFTNPSFNLSGQAFGGEQAGSKVPIVLVPVED